MPIATINVANHSPSVVATTISLNMGTSLKWMKYQWLPTLDAVYTLYKNNTTLIEQSSYPLALSKLSVISFSNITGEMHINALYAHVYTITDTYSFNSHFDPVQFR